MMAGAGGISTLARDAWKGNSSVFAAVSWKRMRVLASRYRRFAFLSAPAAIVNVAWQQGPTVVMMMFYGPKVTGFYLLCMRTIGMPISVIGDAVTQVFDGETAALIRREPRRVYRLFVRCLLALAAAAVLPLGLVALGGPALFAWLFGAEWGDAGEYMRVLLLMFVARMAVAPLSQVLSVLERQELTLLLNVLRFAFTTGVLVVAGWAGLGALDALTWFSGSMALAYGFSALLMIRALRSRIDLARAQVS
jgi:O-antigen/teichoic acid export membrane protein